MSDAIGLHVDGQGIEQCDWLDGVRTLADRSVDLVYVDPPFNTGRVHATPIGAARRDVGVGRATFSDKFESTDAFVDWLRVRVEGTLPKIKLTGGIVIHTDWRTSHRVRVLLDELLGEDRFVNQLVWSYGLGGSSPRRFARKHDDLVWYCMDARAYFFDAPRVAARSRKLAGKTKKMTDVLEVASLNNQARERTGYPTQKPLELLKIVIGACCPKSGLVLDPCCGSGTSLVAARELGMRFVGFDVSADAVRIARARVMDG
jgi:site-specific DNA-methyltransferase (adenine-specific)